MSEKKGNEGPHQTPYGFFPNFYNYKQLQDVCLPKVGIQTGPFGSQLHSSDYVFYGTPIITVEHLGENRIIHSNLPRVTEGDKIRLDKYILYEGDIVFSRVGSVDRRAIVRSSEDGWLFSGRLLRVRPNKKELNPLFLSYLMGLESFKEYIRKIAVGATMPSLNTKILSEIPICYPNIQVQKAIAHILGTLDDKIELNRRMNETLESIARAIFTSWFINFDPVRAKAEGRQPEGMDAATAALFPSEFETVEGQEIPKGWALTPIDQIADFLNGLALQKYPPVGDECLPVIKIAQIRIDSTENSDSASVEIPPEYVIHDGDLIFSWSGSLEVVIWCGGIGALNQHLFKVTSEKYPKWFIYSWLRYHLPWFQDIAAHKATTMGHIQRKHLSEAICYTPDDTVIEQVDSIFSPLFNKIISNKIENKFLSAYRDTLLPKLLSGELPIDNPEQFTGVS